MVKNKLLRVAQMNAIYFDKEVENEFKQHIQEYIKHLPPGFLSKLMPEINLLLQLAIINYSIVSTNSTFGQKMLSIKYEGLTRFKKLCFMVSQCFDYIKERLEMWQPNHCLNRYLSNIDAFIKLMQFLNICIFLRTGNYPKLTERIFGLNQIYSSENAQRQYDDKYMTRELLWNGLIEILVYILPLINYHKITRTLRNINPLHSKPVIQSPGLRQMTLSTRCAQCDLRPVLPHHMGCAHIFCYYCLKGNQKADEKYECPICEYRSDNVMCEPVFSK